MRLNEVLPASLPKSLIPYLLSVLTVRTILEYWCVVTPLHIIIDKPLEFKPFYVFFCSIFSWENVGKSHGKTVSFQKIFKSPREDVFEKFR
jgi:hypothetical protein